MKRALCDSVGAGGAIYFMYQRRARSVYENVRYIVFHFHMNPPGETALRQAAQQRPEINKGRVKILIENARFRFGAHGR